jgi:hypothetical protein
MMYFPDASLDHCHCKIGACEADQVNRVSNLNGGERDWRSDKAIRLEVARAQ